MEEATRSIVSRHRDPATLDLVFPAGAAELLFAIEDPCSHGRSGPFAEWIAVGDAYPARICGRRWRNLPSHNQPRPAVRKLFRGDDLRSENRGGAPAEPQLFC